MKKLMGISTVLLLLFTFGTSSLFADSKHPDPLSILSGRPVIHEKSKNRQRYQYVQHNRHKRKHRRSKRRSRKHRHRSKLSRKLIQKTPLGKVFLGDYTKHTRTYNTYLELKAIDGPMPQDYAALLLETKVVRAPVKIKIVVDKSDQRMYVYRDSKHLHTFKTSTARKGYYTPNGTFRPKYISRMHYSKKYYNSPMPWSIFYYGGFAIHGTNAISRLGRPASHGCIRTHPSSARLIYDLVRKYGKRNTTITVRN